MKRFVTLTSVLVLVLSLALPGAAAAAPKKAPTDIVVRYTQSVSIDGGPFIEVSSSTSPEPFSLTGPTVAAAAVAVASSGSKTVTYRNTAWSLVQPIYYLDNTLSWAWTGSACRIVSRGYRAYAYPGNGWSRYRLNLSSSGGTGTSRVWGKYQYTFKYNGTVPGTSIPVIFFKNLGLQVNGNAGGSSSASYF